MEGSEQTALTAGVEQKPAAVGTATHLRSCAGVLSISICVVAQCVLSALLSRLEKL